MSQNEPSGLQFTADTDLQLFIVFFLNVYKNGRTLFGIDVVWRI